MHSSLKELYYSVDRGIDLQENYTDKGNSHSYIEDYYDKEFTPKKRCFLNILEIGIYRGGSLRLWLDWFPNVNLWGIDNTPKYFLGEIKDSRCQVLFEDAYQKECSDKFEGGFFDYIIDDGPHTLDSHLDLIHHWTPKLKKGGKFIIEDVKNTFTIPDLKRVCENMKLQYVIWDRRHVRDMHDNIIFEICKP
jgi:hypothetical protein